MTLPATTQQAGQRRRSDHKWDELILAVGSEREKRCYTRSNDTEKIASMRRQFRKRKRRARQKKAGWLLGQLGTPGLAHEMGMAEISQFSLGLLSRRRSVRNKRRCALSGAGKKKMKLGHGLSHLLPEPDYVRFEID